MKKLLILLPILLTVVCPSFAETSTRATDRIIHVELSNERSYSYGYGVQWDTRITLSGESKSTRAIKGILVFADLFGEVIFRLRWTINEPLQPQQSITEKGLRASTFGAGGEWLRSTELKDMQVYFEVEEIIYAD